MSDKNSYESAKSDLDKIVTVIFWIILTIGLLCILPAWFTGILWKAFCGTLDTAGWVCDGIAPYIPMIAVAWVVVMVVMIVWGLINRIRR